MNATETRCVIQTDKRRTLDPLRVLLLRSLLIDNIVHQSGASEVCAVAIPLNRQVTIGSLRTPNAGGFGTARELRHIVNNMNDMHG